MTILAVSRISDGVCVAGVTDTGRWIRPTREHPDGWRQLEYSDCRNAKGKWVIRKGNRVAVSVKKRISRVEDGHTEDFLVGDRPPELLEVLEEDEYRGICTKAEGADTSVIEETRRRRSIMIVRPDSVHDFSFCVEITRSGARRYCPRCSFTIGRQPYRRVVISDAEWRACGRQRQFFQSPCITWPQICRHLAVEDCRLTLGGNLVGDKPYLLISGVHLFPVRRFPLDFERE